MGPAGDRHRPGPQGERVTSTRLRSLAGLAVVAAVALSGCDSVPALNGGVAARVDGDTITMDDVASKAASYCAAVELAVGKRLVSSSDAEAAKSAGQDAFAKWIDDHDVVIDPRFNITIDGGVRGRANTDVSFPVSKTAKTAASGEQDQTYAAGLPSSQRCGG